MRLWREARHHQMFDFFSSAMDTTLGIMDMHIISYKLLAFVTSLPASQYPPTTSLSINHESPVCFDVKSFSKNVFPTLACLGLLKILVKPKTFFVHQGKEAKWSINWFMFFIFCKPFSTPYPSVHFLWEHSLYDTLES